MYSKCFIIQLLFIFSVLFSQAQISDKLVPFFELRLQENTLELSQFEEYKNALLHNDFDRAVEVSNNLKSKQKDGSIEHLFLSNCSAWAYAKNKQSEKAISLLNQAIHNNKDYVDTLHIEYLYAKFQLMSINDNLHKENDKIKVAHNLFESCIARNNKDQFDFECLLKLSEVFGDLYFFDKAYKALYMAEEINPLSKTEETKLMFQWGFCCIQNFKYEYAEQFVDLALELNPKQNMVDSILIIESRLLLSLLYKNSRRLPQCLDQLNECVSLDEKLKQSSVYRSMYGAYYENQMNSKFALYYIKSRDFEKSMEFYNRMYAYYDENNQHYAIFTLLSSQALCYAFSGDIPSADKKFKQAQHLHDSLKMGASQQNSQLIEFSAVTAYMLQDFETSLKIAHTASYNYNPDSVTMETVLALPNKAAFYHPDRYDEAMCQKIQCFNTLHSIDSSPEIAQACILHSNAFFSNIKHNLEAITEPSAFSSEYGKLFRGVFHYAELYKRKGIESDEMEEIINNSLSFKTLKLRLQLLEIVEQTATKEEEQPNDLDYAYESLKSRESIATDYKEKVELSRQLVALQQELLKSELEVEEPKTLSIDTSFLIHCSINKVQQALGSREAVLDYLSVRGNYIMTCITKDQQWVCVQSADSINKLYGKAMRGAITGSADQQYFALLYDQLFTEFEPLLQDVDKLIIASDGKLAKLPFELLVSEEQLIQNYQIRYAPSIPVWLKIRSEKHTPLADNSTFLGIAPGFVKKGSSDLAEANLRSVFGVDSMFYRDNGSLPPLPQTIEEVEAVSNLFLQNNKAQAQILVAENATKENVLSYTAEAGILHFATHGLSNVKNPNISGLALSSGGTEYDADDILYHFELYKQKMNADLVVLSACKTGTGKIVEGEGVLALPRGFIYAGVPNVIASLWKVHDEKTKDLMVAFYKHLLEDKVSYAEALRLAKLDCIEKGFLPMDWAGFVLIGN